ncbi:hypothetical protein V2I21_01725 [Campylobacter sp. CLAX-22107-21]|uniref:hypothetical protein n=1 Tax=Campylobacter devanensis TaxID=3161138 RepID=UPI002E9E95A2|nr:hypothetical protein [Campylobacter sp. CLAX-22107-21]
MFKNTKRLNEMLKMLKEYEGITPSYSEFVIALKENKRFTFMFDMDDEFFKRGSISELALAIRMLRGYW